MTVLSITRDARSAKFFEGTAAERLILRRCESCGHVNGFAEEACSQCAGTALVDHESTGRGRVVARTVVHTATGEGATRTAVAIVELSEGPWIHAQIVDTDPDQVEIGLPVVLGFRHPEVGESVPVFAPAPDNDDHRSYG